MSADPLGGLAPGERPRPAAPADQPAPHPERAPAPPRPSLLSTPSTLALLGVLAVFFAVQLWLGKGSSDNELVLFRLGSLYPPAVLDGDFWRLGSYAFLHIGLAHFALNSWALWVLMRPIERGFGSATALGLFAACALAGGAASTLHAVLSAHLDVLAAGASGGIAGLFGAMVPLYVRLRHRLPPGALKSILGQVLVNLLINVVLALQLPVDNFAHLGGLVAGVLLAMLAPLPGTPRRFWQRPAQWLILASAFVLASLEGAAVARAVKPHPRTLRTNGLAAKVPWYLLPRGLGIARGPSIGMVARISRTDEPLRLVPGADSVRLGDRTWVRLRSKGEAEDERLLTLLSSDRGGQLRVEVLCGAPECQAELEPAAEQIAATVQLSP